MLDKPIRQQFADTMLDIGQMDENLVVVVGDISHFALQPFAKACPKRFYNIGICESATISVAAGMAKLGMHAVVHTIAPFLIERGFEQIKLDFCYHELPGNIVTVGSAFDYSNLGSTHHCYGDFALLKTLQNIQIIYPASSHEFDLLFKQAYNNSFLTVYRIPSVSHGLIFKDQDIQVGKGILVEPGEDISIVATGNHLKTALDASEILKSKGYSADILYIHTIKPLDIEIIRKSLIKTRKIIVIEEHMEMGGLGDDILRNFSNEIQFKFASVSIPNTFIRKYGTYQELCGFIGLTSENVSNKALSLLNE